MFYLFMSNILIIIISSIIIILNLIISKKIKFNRNKLTPFECGFDPLSSMRLPFSIQFFLISIIFLIFDIEISLILPIIFYIKMNFLMNMYLFITILLILIFGLYYEWTEGSLNWLK
uniref:NADH-ubiquinone oxidoreductase chain 3 n=1 Tax=Ganaspini sp. ZJUH 20220007 TaxID=2943474 RepID=A0A9E8GDN1_9HYME|nr:NADH dehydrogenase subunit 3 [Ganaspini sp. ZJUH 20220007]